MASKNDYVSKSFSPGLLITLGTIFYALYLSFVNAPNERLMGPVQRIFYFHVGSAIASYISFFLVLVGALGYLASEKKNFDALQLAASEVSFVMCSVVLASGMIWGHSAWNTWFRFEPRLVSFLLLWCLSLSLVIIRSVADPKKVATHAAILGIVGALMVPVVIYSVQFLKGVPQLHPQVVEGGGLRDPRFKSALGVATVAMCFVCALLTMVRYRIELLIRKFI